MPRAQAIYVAVLVHSPGPGRRLREEVTMPLLGALPPEALRRPVNLDGASLFEEWRLASLEEWTADPPVAIYTLAEHDRRDPTVAPDAASGRILPWRR